MSRLGYLVLAYSVVWLAIFGYTLALGRRQKKLLRELAVVKDVLERLPGEVGGR